MINPSISTHNKFSVLLLSIVFMTMLGACNKMNVYEKNTSIPNYQWNYNYQPSFDFTIEDTTSDYNLYVVIRHTDAYKYNNIWLNIGTLSPGDSAMRTQRFDLQLGSDAKGWEGSGMDDIWELRKSITDGPFKFHKKGNYQFTIAQIMRENPLPNIMSIGVRVEKVK